MIRRAFERCEEVRDNMRGGCGQVRITHYWTKDEINGKARLCAHLHLEPGASIGYHEHHDEEEVFVVLSGRAKVQDGDEIAEVSAGDSILTGGGQGHSVEAIGTEALCLMAVIVQY